MNKTSQKMDRKVDPKFITILKNPKIQQNKITIKSLLTVLTTLPSKIKIHLPNINLLS